ncbi:hypothetical protein FD755_016629, partial [Muntiacus reevesi]
LSKNSSFIFCVYSVPSSCHNLELVSSCSLQWRDGEELPCHDFHTSLMMDPALVELHQYNEKTVSSYTLVKEERSEKIPDLKLLVEKKFLALQSKNSDADFQKNEKFVQFKQQLKELKKQCKSACFALVWLF